MRITLKPIAEQVIVVTGASSGIGRATALLAASRGAQVVLAARNGPALQALAETILRTGGRAIAVECDVSDPASLAALAVQAVARCGRIDTWVNNAGVAIASRLEDLPLADARRLFDVNFWGVVNGCVAALPHLDRQGGALINLGSFTSDVAAPYMGIYSASKQAIKGYTDALRIEVMMDARPISITLVKHGPIATPVLQHQRNLLDRQATMPPPFYRPEDVARSILHAAEHPVRDLFVGGAARVGSTLGRMLPSIADVAAAATARRLFRTAELPTQRPDNLYEPGTLATVHGDTHGHVAPAEPLHRPSDPAATERRDGRARRPDRRLWPLPKGESASVNRSGTLDARRCCAHGSDFSHMPVSGARSRVGIAVGQPHGA